MSARCVLVALAVVGVAGAAVLVRRHYKRLPPPPSPESLALAKAMTGEYFQRPDLPYGLPYRLYVPRDYDAKKRYPLVLYLHSAGETGVDNLKPLGSAVASLTSDRMQSIEPFFVMVPQCPVDDQWVNRHQPSPYPNYDQSRIAESAASRLILDVLQKLQERYSIDPGRLYVTGFSMGASGTWDLITRHPGVFAAAVTGSGVNDPSRAEVLKGTTAVWAFHGDQDVVSPVGNTRAVVERLRSLGAEVRYSELKNVGHDCGGFIYYDPAVFQWLFSHSAKPAN